MKFVIRLYAFLLRLYPRAFRDEFADEMLDVFAHALVDAKQGRRAVTTFLLCEFWDTLSAVAHEHWQQLNHRKERMMRDAADLDSHPVRGTEPSSWLETLIGIFPFALFGPITVMMAYPYPYTGWRASDWFITIQLNVTLSVLVIGLVAGVIKGWQRWAFPYLGPWIFIAGSALINGISRLVFPIGPEWPIFKQILIAIAGFTLATAAVILLARLIPFSKLLYHRVREDWTQLSFGLLVGAAMIFGMIEHEEDPYLTLPVILPSVFVFLCALAYLRSTTQVAQVAALIAGVILPTAIRVVSDKTFYLLFGTVLFVVVMLPALIELLPRPKQMVSNP